MAQKINRVTLDGAGEAIIPLNRFERGTVIQIGVSGTVAWSLRWTLADVQRGQTPEWAPLETGIDSDVVTLAFPACALLLEIESGDGTVTALIAQSSGSRRQGDLGPPPPPPPPLFTPLSLFASGEQGAWYDPSDLSTLFQNAAGTVPVTADSQPVRLMLDKSGRNNHLQALTDAQRPLYRTGGGLHWLRFDGVDDRLEEIAALRNHVPLVAQEMIVAATITSATNFQSFMMRSWFASSIAGDAYAYGIGRSVSLNRAWSRLNSASASGMTGIAGALNTPVVLRARFSGSPNADQTFIDDGTTSSSIVPVYLAPEGQEKRRIGQASSGWDCNGVIFLDRFFSAEEAVQVRQYLTEKVQP